MKKAISLSLSLSSRLKKRPGSGHSPGSAFTIVELLVVIVVIAILSVIAFISYSGIASRATASALQSDLAQASKQIKLYQVDHGFYPSSLEPSTNCLRDASNNVDTRYCLKTSSSDISFSSYVVDNNPSNPTFSLAASKVGYATSYVVTNNTSPTSTNAITAIASITGTTTAIGSTLTAGALTPGAATATYQWQRAATSGGTYINIPGATASTYVLTITDIGDYIKVIASGTGIYSGTQASANTVAITDTNWLAIGNQVWAKANLNVGTRIAGASNQTNNATLEKYCYSDTESNCTIYGGLYQWDEAMQYSTTAGAQGICPVNSHIPTDTEWKTLEMQLGMTQIEADKQDAWRGVDEGTKLKSGGSSGLNMPLAGVRDTDGTFYNLSTYAYLWSSSESTTSAWRRHLYTSDATVLRYLYTKAVGFSVRCLGN